MRVILNVTLTFPYCTEQNGVTEDRAITEVRIISDIRLKIVGLVRVSLLSLKLFLKRFEGYNHHCKIAINNDKVFKVEHYTNGDIDDYIIIANGGNYDRPIVTDDYHNYTGEVTVIISAKNAQMKMIIMPINKQMINQKNKSMIKKMRKRNVS